jgi:hypothetical protein
MKVENVGQFFMDGRIINLDSSSAEELEKYITELNKSDEKLVEDINKLLVTLK